MKRIINVIVIVLMALLTVNGCQKNVEYSNELTVKKLIVKDENGSIIHSCTVKDDDSCASSYKNTKLVYNSDEQTIIRYTDDLVKNKYYIFNRDVYEAYVDSDGYLKYNNVGRIDEYDKKEKGYALSIVLQFYANSTYFYTFSNFE